jgi:quercetin dioxygenase-like cupin family protein
MSIRPSRAWRGLAAAGAFVGAFAFAGSALAGECPANQVVAQGQGHQNANNGAKSVTDTVLGMIDLGAEKIAAKGHTFRIRRLVIQPGGIVPWHSHAERPALIYVVSGTILEYASHCKVPIVHKAGEVSKEPTGTSHWWKNTGNVPVVLISADIIKDPNDKNM